MVLQSPCPECGCEDTRRSTRHGLFEHLMWTACVVPFRCRECKVRFFRFRYARANAIAKAASGGKVKVGEDEFS